MNSTNKKVEEKIEDKLTKLAKASFGSYGFLTGDGWSPNDVDKLETFGIKDFQKTVDQCRFFYRKDPIAGTVLNKMVETGITRLILDKGKLSDNEFRIFQAVLDRLQEFMENCMLEYLISGLVIPEIKYANLTKEKVNELGIKKYSTLTLPVSMWLRDPRTVKIESSMIMSDPSYYVILPPELVYFIKNKGTYPSGLKDEELYRKLVALYPEFVAQVEAGNKEILLKNDFIIRRKPMTDSPYPTPYLMTVLESLKHKRNLRRMDYSIASRVISAIQLIRLGNDMFPVTEDDETAFDAIKEQMTWRFSGNRDIERIFQLFANHTLEIEWVYPDVDALLNESKYAEVNQDIFFGLGFPRILTTGETEKTQTSDPEFASISPIKTMENIQSKLLNIVKGIVEDISNYNNLKFVPEVRFDKINMNSYTNFVAAMTALYDTGNVSRTSFSSAFGYTWEEELKLRSVENDKMKALGVEEFAPKPYSNQPGEQTTPKKKPESEAKPE